MLESLKDPNTGQLKKPVLISLIGGAGLFAYLMFSSKGSSGASSVGQSSPLTPELALLQDALKGLTSSSGGASGGSPSLDPPPGFGTVTQPTYSDPNPVYSAPTPRLPSPTLPTIPVVSPRPYVQPLNPILPDVGGGGGNSGGGGAGTGTVASPIASSPVVYGGFTVPVPTGNVGSTPMPIVRATPVPRTSGGGTWTPAPTTPVMTTSSGTPIVVGGMTIPTIPLPTVVTPIVNPATGFVTPAPRTSGGGTWTSAPTGNVSKTPMPIVKATPKPVVRVVTPTPVRVVTPTPITRTSPIAM